MIATPRRWWKRWVGSFTGRRADAAFAEELQTHLDMQIDEYLRAGMPPAEARRRACIKLGTAAASEAYRDQRGLPFIETTRQDLGYAFRSLRGNPGFALVAILSIAIGVGATTAIFSVVKTVLLDPLGYREPGRIFAVREVVPQWAGSQNIPANPLHIREWGRQCPSIEQIAVTRLHPFQLAGGGEPEVVAGAEISASLPALLGVSMRAGRAFTADEEQSGHNRVVLLADSLWRRRFHGDPNAVGRQITLDGAPFSVAGILPPEFRLPYSGGMLPNAVLAKPPEIFAPIVIPESEMRLIGNHNFGATVRLRPGVSPAQALAEINVVQRRFPEQAHANIELRAALIPVGDLFTGSSRAGLWMLLSAVASVLLIVCANLANLLLARNSARLRETAIRSALGASAARQLRQGLTESLVLSLAGGALGVALAALALQAVVQWAPPDIHRIAAVKLDLPILLFCLAISIAVGPIFGALPAWQMSGTDPIEAMQPGASRSTTAGRASLRTRRVLIGVEVALSAALLILGGLLTKSFARLLSVETGFQTERVLVADLTVPGNLYSDKARRGRLLENIAARVGALPGVESAGLVSLLPVQGESNINPISVENDPRPAEERPMVNRRFVSPGYLRAMGIRIRLGRGFEESDRGKPVGILSERAVARVWPSGGNPIGRRYNSFGPEPVTLIGVAADVRAAIDKEPAPIAYHPYWMRVEYSLSLVVRTTAADPMGVAPAVRAAIHGEEGQMPIPEMRTMSRVVEASLAQRRFLSMLVMAFSAFALIVAALGIYGVVAFTVARRRNELGIRLALGAEPGQVMRAVIGQGLAPVAAGLAGGIVAALALGRLIQGLLFEVRPTDPATLVIVTAAILVVAIAACAIPAWKAVAANPVETLRME